MSEVFTGIEAALSFGSLIANVTGVSLGILFGAMPGLTAAMGVALLIPLSFGMPPVEAFSMLLGMYAGAIYGGSITAILVGTPGTVAAAATLLEGPKLTAKGQSRKALEMATFASFFGGIFSAVALVTCAPLLATAAMSFGPAEYFALAVFALTVVATLSSGAMCKGLAAAFVGLFLSTVGIDPVSGDFRNTFDVPELFNGISLVPALVGLFAVSQVLLSLEDVFLGKSGIVKEGKLSNQGLTLREIWTNKFNLLRSSLLGTLIGIIPATGASAATFIAYGEAKRFSKHPEAFGKGTLEGVAATESSNNGVTGGALIPLMTLGVPGDVLTAILLGALMIQGLTPGPLLFQEHGATVNGIFASFFVSNILILVVGLIAVRILGKVVLVPTAILMSVVLTLRHRQFCGQQLHVRHRRNGRLRAAWLPDAQGGVPTAAHAARHDPRPARGIQLPPGAVPLPRRLQHLFHQPHILRHIGRQRLRRPQNHLGRIQGMQARGGLIHPHFFQEEPS